MEGYSSAPPGAGQWTNQSKSKSIQFVGALRGVRARKGLFITTSEFSNVAHVYVARIDTKVVLIDGETLAQLMMGHKVGIAINQSYESKKVDSDCFTED